MLIVDFLLFFRPVTELIFPENVTILNVTSVLH